MQQFFSLLSWRLFTAQHVSGVFPAQPQTQHDCHHNTKVKPEAATAVIELLMMGGKTPETCWAVNKCQDNKLENCCIWLVIYLSWYLVLCYLKDIAYENTLFPLGLTRKAPYEGTLFSNSSASARVIFWWYHSFPSCLFGWGTDSRNVMKNSCK